MAGRCYRWNFLAREKVSAVYPGVLPADSEQTCSRVPAIVVFLAGPILGLGYVFFLPFIGISMVVAIAFGKIIGGAEESAYKGAAFSWQPGEVYLAGENGRARRTISRKEEEKKE